MPLGPRIGQRSTYEMTCMVCGQTYGNAASHDCPYTGVTHGNMHREERRSILSLEQTVRELEERIRVLESRGEDPCK